MNKSKLTTQEIVLYALGMAVVFVATMYIKIPNGLDGYFNLGDGFILLFSSIVSPLGGFLIGGLGSGLADIAGGYAYYFFPTLIIKGLEGFIVASLFRKFGDKVKWIAYFVGCSIMVVGYFFAKWYLKGSMVIALSGVAENLLQSGIGFAISIICLPVIQKSFHSINKKSGIRKISEEQA
ncbi:MAG: ECF transporter S component [Longicatena sp.]